MVDIHCHILPDIDDGAKSIQQSIDCMDECLKDGVRKIVFTPHFYSERMTLEDFLRKRERSVNIILPEAEKRNIEIKIGAEIAFTQALSSMDLSQLAFTGTKYLLLELDSMFEPYDVEGLIRRIRKKGFQPILAHIERYPYVHDNPQLLYRWIKAGALAQINAGWILKDKKAMKRMEKFIGWHLIHFIASDTHANEVRPQNLKEAYEKISMNHKNYFLENALCIFSGEKITIPEPIKPTKIFGFWK